MLALPIFRMLMLAVDLFCPISMSLASHRPHSSQINSILSLKNCLMKIFSSASCVLLSPHSCVQILAFRPAPNISISSEIVAPRRISIYLGLSMSDSLAVLKSLRILQRLLPRDQSQMAAVTTLELWLISFLLFPFYAASFVYCYLIIFSLFFC